MCLHGTPHTMISDRGEQLVAAANQVEGWDFSVIQDWMTGRKIRWKFVPAGGQHMNGQAERLIGQVKKVFKSTLENKSCSFNELNTILYESALIVNTRPIGIAGRESDLEAGTPITPLHLMLGRASIEAPQMDFHNAFNLTRRLQFVEEVKREFWNKWKAIVFQGLDKSYRWRQNQRDSQVGDVVLLKDETVAACTYKLARVIEVIPDERDGKIRKVIVAYKNFNERVFRQSTRPVHKIVLIVPAEDAELPPLPPPADGGPPVAAPDDGGPPVAAPDDGGPPVAAPADGGPPVVAPDDGGPPVAAPDDGGPPVAAPADGGPPVVAPDDGGPPVAAPDDGGPPVAAPDDGGPPVAAPDDGGPHVAAPADGGPSVVAPDDGGPPVAAPDDGGHPVAAPADGGPPVAAPDDGGPPVAAPDDGGVPAPVAQPGDRTMQGRHRQRRTFYPWDFPDRMRRPRD
jgi:Family of unknown function (DUF5641)